MVPSLFCPQQSTLTLAEVASLFAHGTAFGNVLLSICGAVLS